jgi:Zn-dependent protease with chaperone function
MEGSGDSAASALNTGFTQADLARAREYRRALYLVTAVAVALDAVILSAAAFGRLGEALYHPFANLPWWAAALAYPALLVALLSLVGLPLRAWSGWARERRFGFTTQSLGSWLGDRAKAFAVEAVLAALALGGLVAVAHELPDAWPAVVAPAAGALVVLLSFVAPIVLEPLFNRFQPLQDPALAADLRALAGRAGVPIRDVLVADASRRTTKQNAYVSGLGRTRRVVVFDTLLEAGDDRLVALVVAHELGHRRAGHVAKLTAAAALGAAGAVVALSGLLSWNAVLGACGADGAGDPRIVPFVLLAALALEIAVAPLAAGVSRHMERTADRASLELTDDLDAFERAHRELALANLSDLTPPRPVYLALFGHPTPPERIEAARRWAAVHSSTSIALR